ncbi:MAG TPA: hypothetical protein G4O19_01415 [Dehalococcoidia bacterium]|nr:hypothetical protein [Dehalococcoidia bacterium]
MSFVTNLTAVQMRCILYLLLALVVADGILSNFLVSQDMGYELNPFLKGLVGGESLLLLKVCGTMLAATLLWGIYKRAPKAAIICSLSFAVLYTAILYWNTFAFLLAV